jgi:hypothetical protein
MYVPCEDLSDLSDGQNWFHSSTISTHWELSIQHCLKLLDSKILAGVWIYSWNFWFHGSVSLRTSLQRISAKVPWYMLHASLHWSGACGDTVALK